jgi:hypothetical protein
MSILKRRRVERDAPWQPCLECGNRYQAASRGYKVNWCSIRCESAALRRQREEIETTWIRATWFLR